MCLSCTFLRYSEILAKIANLNLPRLYLVPPLEFRRDLRPQKTRISRLSYSIVCMILRLAVLVQYCRVTDGQTDRQTDTR